MKIINYLGENLIFPPFLIPILAFLAGIFFIFDACTNYELIDEDRKVNFKKWKRVNRISNIISGVGFIAEAILFVLPWNNMLTIILNIVFGLLLFEGVIWRKINNHKTFHTMNPYKFICSVGRGAKSNERNGE